MPESIVPDPILVDLIGWIAAVDVPVFAALLWQIWRHRRDTERALAAHCVKVEETAQRNHDELAAHRLEVARNYVPVPWLREVDRRLTAHLLRIEAKLDAAARRDGAA